MHEKKNSTSVAESTQKLTNHADPKRKLTITNLTQTRGKFSTKETSSMIDHADPMYDLMKTNLTRIRGKSSTKVTERLMSPTTGVKIWLNR